jgi:hypothetical protein
VDRLGKAMAQLSGLAARAGHGDVVDNLADAAMGLFGSGAVTVAALIAGKPALTARISTAVDTAGTSLQAVEWTFTDYLAAERDLGRVPADVDVDVLAFTMVSAVDTPCVITLVQSSAVHSPKLGPSASTVD